jgi:GNAT superfamily N-acetyltransferase
MRYDEEMVVRDIAALCHPEWPERPTFWYTAFPTLVALMGNKQIIGYTAFAINTSMGLLMVAGQDIGVDPAFQGQGVGAKLHRYRLDVGSSVGARMFCGPTQPDNTAMIAIFEAEGHHACQQLPKYFPDGKDGVLYLGDIRA